MHLLPFDIGLDLCKETVFSKNYKHLWIHPVLSFFLHTWDFNNFESILIKVGCNWLLVRSTNFSTRQQLGDSIQRFSAAG